MTKYNGIDASRTPSDGIVPEASGGAKTARRKPAARPAQLFDDSGLKAMAAARTILAQGPLMWGSDGRFWAYDAGVYVPGEDVVHGRIVRALGDRYRTSHSGSVRDVLRALIDPIECEPVPRFINFTNGLLDWNHPDGPKLVAHDPKVPTTVQLTIAWEPKAQCPRFNAFLAEVIADGDRPRVWEVIGYMLMSGNPLHRAFLLAGGGRNGKSAFMRTILAILGKGNVSHVPLADFSGNRFATAQLFGRMANVCGDIDATYLENTGRFKEASGEDEVSAEHKFGQPFRFTPWCSMLFSANEIPGSADSSTGWLDRWEIIPFPNYIGDRVDKTLEPDLQAVGSLQGIAAQAVAALRVLMSRQAFRTTDAGAAAKEEFARKSNQLIQWIDDHCVLGDAHWEKAPVLYNDYAEWAVKVAGSSKPLARARFYEKLKQLGDRGIVPAKRGVEGFKGITVKGAF